VHPSRIVTTLDRPAVALALSAATFLLPVLFVVALQQPLDQPFGKDVALYREASARWLGGGPFYEPRQLAGSYDVAHGDILYPPVALWLFTPLAILPEAPALVAWWSIPAALTVWVVARLRPRPAYWPLIALCLAWPTTPLKVWTGNPVIWSLAAMALATVWRGGAPFALLKPSLFPFALFGITTRAWWIGFAFLVLLSLPFWSMWLDWMTAVANSRGAGLLYSALEAPLLALPLVAWAGRRATPPGPLAADVQSSEP
jgi:hypothetical protein